jgi:uncharacterized membrane protein YgcG
MQIIFSWLISGLIVAAVAASVRHLWQVKRERDAAVAESKRKREEAMSRYLKARVAARTAPSPSRQASTGGTKPSAISQPYYPPDCEVLRESWSEPCKFDGAPAFSGGGGSFDGGGASGDWSSSSSCSSPDSSSSDSSCGSSD